MAALESVREGRSVFEIDGAFVIAISGQGTRVTWKDVWYYSRYPWFRCFGPMMDRAMGHDFEKGLEALDREAAKN